MLTPNIKASETPHTDNITGTNGILFSMHQELCGPAADAIAWYNTLASIKASRGSS